MRRIASSVAVAALSVALAIPAAFNATSVYAEPATALAGEALQTLTLKGKGPKTGYSRARFGPAWADVDGNGCNTRDDILARDLQERQMSGRCRVLAGVLAPDPYTGVLLRFVRGRSLVDIDHVVALGQAWQSGAAQWDDRKRLVFANDPLNLLAVSASANRQKGDREASAWLPSNKGFRCAFIARQIAVKSEYGLSVTTAEKIAMGNVLSRCPEERVPRASDAVSAPTSPTRPNAAPNTSQPNATVNSQGKKLRRYRNCAEARAAGVAPIRRDTHPHLYLLNSHLDRDRDGIGCE